MGDVIAGPWARRVADTSVALEPYDPGPDLERYLGVEPGPEVRPSGLILRQGLVDALEARGLVGHHLTIDG